MNNTEGPTIQLVPQYLTLGSAYAVSVGILYLWGYWSTFHVNILEYLSLAEVVKVAAYPLVSSFVFLAIGAAIGEFIYSPALPEGGGRDTLFGRFLLRASPYLRAVYFFGTLALFLFGPVTKWYYLSFLFAIPVYSALKPSGFLNDMIPHDRTRSFVIYMLLVLPTYAYGIGKIHSTQVLEGVAYDYLAEDTIGVAPSSDPNDPRKRIKFLGQVNDHLFLLAPDNGTLIITQFEKTRTLVLRRHDTKVVATSTNPNKPVPPPQK